MINNLEEGQYFVFGSNLSGLHAGGAAKQAKEMFNAVEGIGEGITGRSYAFPTLGYGFEQLSKNELVRSKDNLYRTCKEHFTKEFLLTKVGCGFAGYGEGFIKSLFTNPPVNLVLPEDWK